MRLSTQARDRARQVRYLLLDVDGVLTDGRLVFGAADDAEEIKAFDTKDGVGIRLALEAGLGVGLLTGRVSRVVERRARELGIVDVLQGATPKLPVFQDWCRNSGRSAEEICYVGDDIVDVPILRRVILPAAVADAHDEARRVALLVSERRGGRGAVREIVDLLLRAQGKWEQVVAPILG
jgi:3-deoxy-D-manno-octulosonate 8-phosphate phosphatase (KDO 8-P phosphatase)